MPLRRPAAALVVAMSATLTAGSAHGGDEADIDPATTMTAPVEPGTLTCVVFGSDGLPAPQVRVRAGNVEGATDDDGAVRLTLPAGRVALEVEQQGAFVVAGDVVVSPGAETEALVALSPGAAPRLEVEAPPDARPSSSSGSPSEPSTEAQSGPAATGRGAIVGHITSLEGGRPLAGVRVLARGTSQEALSDDEGRFRLELPAGEHALSFVHPEHSAEVREGVVVRPGEEASLDAALSPAAVALETFRVEVPHVSGSLASALDERRASGGIREVLGAEQISQGGDGDAAGALRRAPGVTVVGGRYVYVRGLGERYSSTLLNGAPLPSPEPERRVVPLDLFPTGVLDGMAIHKSWSPDLPADFGGGTVDLRTRGIPEGFVASAKVQTGGAVGSTFREGLTYGGGPLDLLGFDAGHRGLPADVRAASDAQPLLERDRFSSRGYTAAELERFGEEMGPAGGLSRQLLLPDGGVDVELGDRFELGPVTLGYRAGAGWSTDQRRQLEARRYYLLGKGGALELAHAYDFERATRAVEASGLLTVGALVGDDHEVTSTTLLGRLSDDEARVYQGKNRDVGAPIRVERLRWVERTLLSQQLQGRHELPWLFGVGLDWSYTYALALRHEPDTREVRYDNEPGSDRWLLSDRPEGNQRLFSDLLEHSHDASLALRFPFTQWNGLEAEAKVGGQASHRARTVDTRRFKYMHKGPKSGDPRVLARAPDRVFTKDTIGPDGFQLEEITRQTDNYDAEQTLLAAFALVDFPLWTNVRLHGGVRVEHGAQRVRTYQLFNPDDEPVLADLTTTDVLPAGTLSFALPFDMQLRLGGSLTVSRPDFRELSPATFNDVTGGRQTFGNPELERALIAAGDARWEWYPRRGSSLSLALFYKHFDKPIEQVVVLSAQQSITFANAKAADNTGIELEARTDLGLLHPLLSPLFLAGNAALIYSRVELSGDGVQTSKERPLQGQSPWVANLQVGWDDEERGTRLVALYNVFGPRIAEVGAQGAPDVYEQPFHSLDLVFAQELPWGFTVSAKAQNLLDLPLTFTQGEHEVARLLRGRSFSVGLEWRFQ